PAKFNGKFVAFMSHAAETTAAAAPCPTKELNKYTTPRYLKAKAKFIAAQLGEPVSDVTVKAGKIGESSPAEKNRLHNEIENFTHMRDANGKKIPRIDVSFMSTSSTGVEDACFVPYSKEKLSDLPSLTAPQAATVPSK